MAPKVLKRLRSGISAAIDEIKRLRKENDRLSDRIEQLEQRPDVDPDTTLLAFDAPPDDIRQHVEQMISVIDEELERT